MEGFAATGFEASLIAEAEEGAPKLKVAPDACALVVETVPVVAAVERGLFAPPKKESGGAVGEVAVVGVAGAVCAAGLPKEAAGAVATPQVAEEAGAVTVLPNG